MADMKQGAPISSADEDYLNRRTLWSLLAGIFLISFSLLAFEITLTRVLSVVLLYHYVFLVISMALLGLGAGGIFVHLFRQQIAEGYRRFSSLALIASLLSLSIPFSIIVMTRVAYITNPLVALFLYCLFLFLPFFLTGVLMAEVFRFFPTLSSRIYGADLVGAAAGSLGVVLTLNTLGDISSAFLLALITAIAALVIALSSVKIGRRGMILPIVSLFLVAILLVTNLAGYRLADVPIGKNPVKDIFMFLQVLHGARGSAPRGEIVETRWSAFGRTDLVKPYNESGMMALFIDGAAGTPMFRFNGDVKNPDAPIQSLKTEFEGYLPFLFLKEEERDNALIIGPGGGRDILMALMGGVGRITAVEVNKELVDIVREYADYNGGIYTNLENVSVVVDEGRSFLKRQKEKYDIIMLALTVTKTSRSLEGFALTENFLYTTEAIDDYLEHLTDEGQLIFITHDPIETLRLLSISLAALEQKGINTQAAMQRIYIAGADHYSVFVMKKAPFVPAELARINQTIEQRGYEPVISKSTSLAAISKGEASLTALQKRFLEEIGQDIRPVTDNSPFFHKFKKGIPFSVTIVFWASVVMLLLAIIGVSFIYRRKRSSHRVSRKRVGWNQNLIGFVVFFSMLGTGFMLVEISTIQRFILFLGQPVLSLAILLFSLLLGAGIGSLYSNRFRPESLTKMLTIISGSIIALLLVYVFLLPFILEQLLGLALAVRILTTIAIISPLGFLMGFPFPSGLRLLKEMGMEDYIPWMWGINGIASVLGAAMTLVVAISLGFTQALLLGAGCYFMALFALSLTNLKEV